jgi:hypothetical protein
MRLSFGWCLAGGFACIAFMLIGFAIHPTPPLVAAPVVTVPVVNPRDVWVTPMNNPAVTDADSLQVGQCRFYQGYFHGHSYRHMQCPESVRYIQTP